jgi:hypothetical protein
MPKTRRSRPGGSATLCMTSRMWITVDVLLVCGLGKMNTFALSVIRVVHDLDNLSYL